MNDAAAKKRSLQIRKGRASNACYPAHSTPFPLAL